MRTSTIGRIFDKIAAKIFRQRVEDFKTIKNLFIGKCGLEVGGPSRIFKHKGLLPLYKVVNRLDGCNFSNDTIWEGRLKNGSRYKFHPLKNGIQYISEASDLSHLPSAKYDFVISSNCLEHVANPLKAIEEWLRVVKMDGLLLIVVPNKEYCFDHNRPITQFTHLLSDFQNNIQEDDLTHLETILSLHDLDMDKPAGTPEQFKARSLKNFENRALHQHVFDIPLLTEIFNYFQVEILKTYAGRDYIILGRKKQVN